MHAQSTCKPVRRYLHFSTLTLNWNTVAAVAVIAVAVPSIDGKNVVVASKTFHTVIINVRSIAVKVLLVEISIWFSVRGG